MKEENIWIPSTFENRKPLVIQKVLYIPKNYDIHQDEFSSLNLADLFLCKKKFAVEYCSGNGQWIIEKAKNIPDTNWIAVEKRLNRAKKIWNKMQNYQLNNLFVVFAEAEIFTKHYLKDHQISSIFINFPDPWPKRRQAKHRLIKENFLIELQRILISKGEITLVTDDENYRNQMIDVFLKMKQFKPKYPFPFYQTNLEKYGSSFFENLWISKGRNIFYLKYIYEK